MFIDEALYRKIITLMPIPCVDLLVRDPKGRILLVKRKNEPALGEWWFPGGRVHFGELREDAARRKLREECGLAADSVEELGTFEIILPLSTAGMQSHAISTLFRMNCDSESAPVLDAQSKESAWKSKGDWLQIDLPVFVRARIQQFHEDTSFASSGSKDPCPRMEQRPC
ncbi:MAG TPA: NUDIX domain-containing protein [Planctomycetota bacterium]|jgi:ADP-ribose pyrophosphatase YjhB (NUDIX family)